MIVTLKTLQEDTFTVEIDPSESVKRLKEQIEKLRGSDYPAKSMKLMYAEKTFHDANEKAMEELMKSVLSSGKFLVDGKQVCDYNVEEKKFVIVVTKQTNQPVLDAQEGSSVFINGSNQSSNRERIQQMEYDQMVSNIVELGFSRADVVHALTASYHNPDRAVEYLINTISATSRERSAQDMELDFMNDDVLMRQVLESGPPSPDIPSQERIFELFSEAVAECRNRSREQDELAEREHERITRTYAEMEAGGMRGPLSAIREELNNAFGPMSAGSANILSSLGDIFSGPVGSAAAGSTNPHGSAGASSTNPPRSAGASSTNPPRSAGTGSTNSRSAGTGSTNPRGSTGTGVGDRAPPLLSPPDFSSVPLAADPNSASNTFFPVGEEYAMFREVFGSAGSIGNTGNLLERDHEAISRLTQLGFSNQKAIEAYYVCEKNENAAAEYLFSQNFD